MNPPSKPRRLPLGAVLFGLFVLAYAGVSAHRNAELSRDLPFVEASSLDARAQTSTVPVLVEFWASWCGYCRALDAPLSRLARHYAGRLTVVRVDFDTNVSAKAAYAVTGVPFLLILKRGGILARHQGSMSEDELFDFVARALPREGEDPGRRDCAPGPGAMAALPICD